MYKFFILVLFLTFFIYGREELLAMKECSAFNDLKHSKNTHNIILDTAKKYTILKYHKGQVLILLKGEQPSQRWVNDECFIQKPLLDKELNLYETLSNSSINTDLLKETKTYEQVKKNLLVLSWHNAFCETHRNKIECKRTLFSFSSSKYKEQHFVLHGLWPQPRSNIYCNIDKSLVRLDTYKQWDKLPIPELSTEVQKDLRILMPGIVSNLHKHQWIKHGTCYGRDANSYFKDAFNLLQQVNDSKVGNFFRQHIGKYVTLQQIRTMFNRSFGNGTGKHVELKCKKGLISELWLHLGSGSDDLATLLKKGKIIRSYCQGGIIDKAGFGR